ncbi:MAG TPA: chemotaxis protein CheW [Candidatus Eisenbacteria bacterium]
MRADSAVHHGTRGVLVIPIGDVLFGARVEEVAGLIDADRLVSLPGQREPMAGVVAFRGGMVPALDLCAYLDVEPMAPAGSRYAIVLARGAERFALLVPKLPRLIAGRELREGKLAIGDSELGSLIECVYQSDAAPIHCLRYWSIFDNVVPPEGARAAGASRH